MIKFFQELDPNDNNAETKAGNDDASLLPHVKAKNLLTTVLTSIVSALLGRPISQANNKDRRATEEEKKDIGVLLSQGTVEKKTDKKNVKQIAPGLITTLIKNMKLFDVEAKKALVIIMQTLVRESDDFRKYVCSSQSDDPTGISPIVAQLVKGFDDKHYSAKFGIALHTGPMLMTIIRNDERTAKSVLNIHLNHFLPSLPLPAGKEEEQGEPGFVQSESFDIKGIAFDTLRDLLFNVADDSQTYVRKNAAEYINAQWSPSLDDMKKEENAGKPSKNEFFEKLNLLIKSRDFTTVKATVKLLQSILFCTSKSTFESMLQYVGDPRNLIVAMNLLRDTAKQLQFEGFHLFKVFVLNPNRPKTITTILTRNKAGMIAYLDTFQQARQAEDPAFERELSSVKNAINQMDSTKLKQKTSSEEEAVKNLKKTTDEILHSGVEVKEVVKTLKPTTEDVLLNTSRETLSTTATAEK